MGNDQLDLWEQRFLMVYLSILEKKYKDTNFKDLLKKHKF